MNKIIDMHVNFNGIHDYSDYNRYINTDATNIHNIGGDYYYMSTSSPLIEIPLDTRFHSRTWTIDLWLNIPTTHSKYEYVYTLSNGSDYLHGNVIGVYADLSYIAQVGISSGEKLIKTVNSSVFIQPAKLTLITVTYNYDVITTYLDGVYVDAIDDVNIGYANTTLYIGGDPRNGGRGSTVYINRVTVYDSVLYTTNFVPEYAVLAQTPLATFHSSNITLTDPQAHYIQGQYVANKFVYLYNDKECIEIAECAHTGDYVFHNVLGLHDYIIRDGTNNVLVDTRYIGTTNIQGFVEGVMSVYNVTLLDFNHENIATQTVTDFSFSGFDQDKLNGFIKIDNQLTPTSYYTDTPQVKGYLTGSVNSDCEGTDFKIRCYREDGFFVGDYVIQENGMYEIPNLNVNSSYDILLHDNNASVETMVNSRRIPTKYQ